MVGTILRSSLCLVALLGACLQAGNAHAAAAPARGNSADGYVKPVPTGILGSGWCACRDVGTSPHIGQDWRLNGGTRSVALNRGTVQEITFSASCGYAVILKDKNGAKWRYLHLNKPTLRAGATVAAGDLIGKHGTYPKSSCGTGPHLHLERHSAGPFGDSARRRDCGRGIKNCNYNPNSPYNSFAEHLQDLAPIAVDETETTAANEPEPEICRQAADETRRAELPLASKDAPLLDSKLTLAPTDDGRLTLAFDGALAGNAANSCGAENERECVVSWSVYVQQADGWQRLFSSQAVRNAPLSLSAEVGYCAGAGQTVAVVARTNRGRTLKVLRKG